MLKIAVGFATSMIDAKERAIYFYDQVKEKKVFKFVETQQGFNEVNEPAWVTTIWYETVDTSAIDDTVEEKEDDENYYIGSTTVSPNDPDWREKLQALQQQAATDSLEETKAWEDTTNRDS